MQLRHFFHPNIGRSYKRPELGKKKICLYWQCLGWWECKTSVAFPWFSQTFQVGEFPFQKCMELSQVIFRFSFSHLIQKHHSRLPCSFQGSVLKDYSQRVDLGCNGCVLVSRKTGQATLKLKAALTGVRVVCWYWPTWESILMLFLVGH